MLRIEIHGLRSEGKTTLLHLIKGALNGSGLCFVCSDKLRDTMWPHQADRLAVLANRLKKEGQNIQITMHMDQPSASPAG